MHLRTLLRWGVRCCRGIRVRCGEYGVCGGRGVRFRPLLPRLRGRAGNMLAERLRALRGGAEVLRRCLRGTWVPVLRIWRLPQ
jgi:hypothetical protein